MQASVEDETFPREQVVYSLVKISKDLIVHNFVGTYLPSTLTKETVEALCDYCATMQLGIVSDTYMKAAKFKLSRTQDCIKGCNNFQGCLHLIKINFQNATLNANVMHILA